MKKIILCLTFLFSLSIYVHAQWKQSLSSQSGLIDNVSVVDDNVSSAGVASQSITVNSTLSVIEGNYHSVGYFYHPTSPRAIQLDKIIIKESDSIYSTKIADLGLDGLRLTIHKDNKVTYENSYIPSISTITATADSVNFYDPLLKKFNLHYQYSGTNGIRYIREVLTCFTNFSINGITYSTLNNNEVELTKGDTYSGILQIPQTVSYDGINYTVTTIAPNAFTSDTLLTAVVLPNTITTIGSAAFVNCKNLTTVNLPSSLKSIGDWAFQWTAITSFTIPTSITNLGANPFETGHLETLNVDAGNTNFKCIDGVLFNTNGTLLISCIQTKSGVYEVPNTVTTIGNESFGLCTKLTSVNMPITVTSIEDGAFQSCHSLTSLAVPVAVTKIGAYAFSGCSSLTTFTLPNKITSIEIGTFMNCSGLTSITIPNSVTSIGHGSFMGCSNLISIISTLTD